MIHFQRVIKEKIEQKISVLGTANVVLRLLVGGRVRIAPRKLVGVLGRCGSVGELSLGFGKPVK